MTELAALRAAAYADPDDDATRLVLGDYLSERGDPRGELVHVQTKLARMSPQDPAARELHDRQYALIAKLGRPPNGVEVRYERGFAIAKVEAWWATEDAIGFLRDEPLIEQLTISRCGGGGERWSNIGRLVEQLLERIRVLRLDGVIWQWWDSDPGTGQTNFEDIDERAECAAMFAQLPPRPATLVVLDLPDGVELPASWRR